MDGNTIAVGCSSSGAKKVYVFSRIDSNAAWSSVATTIIVGHTDVAGFGHAISISGIVP